MFHALCKNQICINYFKGFLPFDWNYFTYFQGSLHYWQILFRVLQSEIVNDHADLVTEAADSLMNLEHYSSALKYYLMLEESAKDDNVRKIMPVRRNMCIFHAASYVVCS